jgi:hypothetical protein
MLLFVLLPFTGWAQQKNYYAQHVSIKQTTGDSIQYDISSSSDFKPVIKDGKVVWSFQDRSEFTFTLENVESVDFRSFEYDERETRKALIEFYQEMDGDNWPEEYKTNWCSDKPIREWYGVNWLSFDDKPWVNELDVQSLGLESSRPIPESISRMGPIKFLWLSGNNFIGSIPEFIGWNYNLLHLELGHNMLSGDFPKSFMNFAQMPDFWSLGLCTNQFDGQLPGEIISNIMDVDKIPGQNIDFKLNRYSGKVPDIVKNHPKFNEYWPGLLIQEGGGMDFSDLDIPAPIFSFKDINGNTIDLKETYKKNKYTLLYKWGWWCSPSEVLNQQLIPACLGYKEKGLEIIGLHVAQDMDNEETELKEYIDSHSIPWNNALFGEWNYTDTGIRDGTSVLMWTPTTPEVLLVDQKGNIVFNSFMDEKGNYKVGDCDYRNKLFSYLEEHLGKIDYDFYTSTDYTHDGVVEKRQEAATGQGIDVVFVGEGFTDKDIAEGVYNSRMMNAIDQFFAYEPYTSLRDRFNIYTVEAVSPNAEFIGNTTHAIDEDISKALEYASKVPDLIPNRPMHVVVVYNNPSGGRSYCMMMEDDSFVCFAMDGVSTVLNHEAGGHGFGKLFDEYVENGNETLALPEEDKTEMENKWTTLGWGANVDWRSNPAEVKWAKFINDEHYADERIGVYEGSYLYGSGAYRPTENSMMRNNDTPFNAPSREEIYKRVMKESEGDSWTYDYETFVEFDLPGHEQFVSSLSNVSGARGEKVPKMQDIQRTAPPVFLKGTWRDALKKK